MIHLRTVSRLLKRCFHPQPRENKILVLLDFDNIIINMCEGDLPPPGSFSLVAGFERLMRQLGKIGKVVEVFVFAPLSTVNLWLDSLHTLGFRTITCPKIVTGKTGSTMEKKDIVDPVLIDLGKRLISEMPGLTHLCIGSGDSDFIPLAQEAERQGLDIIIVAGAGNPESLSPKLARFACRDPFGQKAIYLFSPEGEDD